MDRKMTDTATTVVLVLDGDTDAGFWLARNLLAEGRRVAVTARHAGDVVRVMHGYPADRVMVIAGDTTDKRQWSRITERVMERFGRLDTVVRAEHDAARFGVIHPRVRPSRETAGRSRNSVATTISLSSFDEEGPEVQASNAS
jgi:NAD(P)-dependent dehydrogenase (short-subunit alcohol dehydrogenase family)